jgi:lysophospholipase L1-like esterase
MAVRATAMDRVLRQAGRGRHVPVDPSIIDSGFFAADGFHPSSAGYRAWADVLAGPVAQAV